MSYDDKREATANLGQALESLGWKLYGWHDDQSDMQSDYWDPEHWDGVATKGKFVAAVNVAQWQAQRSGKPEIRRVPQRGDDCPRCKGSGVDPTGWTLTNARENPREYHREMDVALGAMSMMRDVVSPIPFDESGRRHCVRCDGRGYFYGKPKEEVVFTWPIYQANPRPCTWHVETGGKIVAKGVGLNKALDKAGAALLASRIDRAIQTAKRRRTKGPKQKALLRELDELRCVAYAAGRHDLAGEMYRVYAVYARVDSTDTKSLENLASTIVRFRDRMESHASKV